MPGLQHSPMTAAGAILGVLAVAGCSADTTDRPAQAAQSAAVQTPSEPNQDLLLAAARVALPPPGIRVGDLPDPTSNGARSVGTFCVTCHNLPAPTLHAATDWPSVVRRMWLRMDRLPQELRVPVPSVAERHWILDYLVANALQVSGSALPAGTGRESFSVACSRCHALPDPRQHSPEDWPTVIMRMEQRMNQMNVDVPQPDEMGRILTYLTAVSGPSGGP